MFKKARIKLTLWYLTIIMVVSLFFSLVIYAGINNELRSIENFQKGRMERNKRVMLYLDELSKDANITIRPTPPAENFQDDINIKEVRLRIITILGIINLSILGFSGISGYFLAGQTLQPIKLMVDEQKDFVSNASHELRTPLTSLKSEIEVALRDKDLSLAEAKLLIKSNLEEVDKMQKLTNYLLALNKFQNGKSSLEMKEVDLKGIAMEAIDKLQKVAKNKNIKTVTNLKSVKVNGDSDSLEELLTILLDNAVKYSSKNSEIKINLRKNAGKAVIEIKDKGLGITKADLPHIFDRFYRADFSRSKEKIDGYGLGLSIAKSIVDAHGGEIKVESESGKGTTFKVLI